MSKFWYAILFLALFSCKGSTTADPSNGKVNDSGNESEGSFVERAKKEIEVKLNIPASENYQIDFYYEHLNGDSIEDAIITVNRLEYAINESNASSKGANKKLFGYMGNYNAFFLYDGKTDKISVAMNVASSAKSPLKVHFENVQSEAFKDVTVEYRIREASFRNYYAWQNNQLLLVFQWKLFDQVGSQEYEANFITLDKGSYSLSKDILIYKGKIKNYSTQIPDVYTYNPTIEKNGELIYRFFYNPREFKYMTQGALPAN